MKTSFTDNTLYTDTHTQIHTHTNIHAHVYPFFITLLHLPLLKNIANTGERGQSEIHRQNERTGIVVPRPKMLGKTNLQENVYS